MCILLGKNTSSILLAGIVVFLAAVGECNVLETPTLLNHITMLNDGRLAVGAVNHVYIVDSDLTVLQNVSTGPVNNRTDCLSSSCASGVMTDNYNKILAVHNDTLITCGNVRQGTCEVRRLCNISDYTADRSPYTMVAANTPEASTVGVVIPGKDAICVGVTYTKRKPWNVYTVISTRALPDLLLGIGVLKIKLNKPIVLSYKYGFHMDNYTYFLFHTTFEGIYVSKIARICDNDVTYYSYIEIPMECKHGNTNYDIVQSGTVAKLGHNLASAAGVSSEETVLVAVFHRSGVSGRSAICVFRFENITAKINENGNECFQKGKHTNAWHYYQGNQKCKKTPEDYSDTSCGELAHGLAFPENTPLVGTISVPPSMTIEMGGQLSSIAIKTVNNHTVVYAGTRDGVLKKIHVKSANEKITFKTLSLGDERVMEDMAFDDTKKNIFVMSGKKLYKVPTYECESFTSCADCVAARDPHCGWCTLENKCSLSSECQAVGIPKKWYNYDADPSQCIEFSKIEPTEHLSTGAKAINLYLNISQLPQDNNFTCVFGNISLPAIKTTSGVQCMTPDPGLFDHGNDHTVVTLSLNSSETGILFISKNFTFFSCKALTTCTTCTGKVKWGCQWCVYDHKCMHSSDNVTCKPGNVNTTSLCPRIDNYTTPILLPSGHKKEFVLKTKELPTPMDGQSGYECKVKVNDRTFTTSVSIEGDNVTCLGNTEYVYLESEQTKQVNISLVWNGDFEIDNPTPVSAEMYKCPLLGPECGICHNLTQSYSCAWNDKCVYTPSGVKKPCPFITINTVFPLNTTVEGYSIVTLKGENLGYSSESVKHATTLVGVPCTSLDERYDVSKEIVCRAGKREAGAGAGEIKVEVDGVTGTSSSNFEYKDPKIFDVTPKRGPKSGGTRITITGESLESGSWQDHKVLLSNVSCELLERTDNKTVCLLHGVETQGERASISMEFENEAKRVKNLSYNFTEDPTITALAPLRAFVGGGRRITVTGTNFTSIQQPVFFVRRDDGLLWETACRHHSDTVMVCPSPNVPPDTSGNSLKIGFIMDNVTAVRNMQDNFPNVSSSMTFVDNPKFFNFTETIKELKEPQLIITGENLNMASSEGEVTVTIGNGICNVTALAKAEMVCTAPEKQPQGIDKDGQWSKDVLPTVTIRVGNLKFVVGKVRYYTYVLSPGAMGGIVVGITVPLIIIVILVVFFRRRSHKEQRNNKKMQIQLETLESNVRDECRQAFAELQTDMSDLTSDLVTSGIPFLDFKTYIDKVLFPGNSDHPALNKDEDPTNCRGMDQFGQLLLNKHFLLKLIRTLEEQKTFGVRDKANVASLLMVLLTDQMEYATEILKTLLGELIERCVEQKRAKLLLRRTESVVEKMLTHWLSICMYEYMQGSSGQALFIMLMSVKHQIQKGPVDAITGDARYSLAENRLLLEKIEPLTRTVEIMLDNGDTIPDVKVLDCDTITQVKEKLLDAIYKNTAFSERISSQDTELEWRHGHSGHLTLSDDDVTSVVEEGWKKLNTLQHYTVPDNSQMAVVSKQHNNNAETQNAVSDADMVTLTMNEEISNKYWHLVKTDDMEQRDESKVISEIFLTRLLSTKGTLQKFVDDFVQSILRVDDQLPPAIKYLFDFLDESAKHHCITDPEVVYTWKSNSLPLRFWVNVIKNPDFVFDIHKSTTVDSSLSVIAQTFMDSCSTAEQRLGKDSPTNKLLFAKDIVKYKKLVENFYARVQELASQSEQEMYSAMVDISRNVPKTFNKPAALRELFDYVTKYDTEITCALEEDPAATKAHLPQKLERVKSAVFN